MYNEVSALRLTPHFFVLYYSVFPVNLILMGQTQVEIGQLALPRSFGKSNQL